MIKEENVEVVEVGEGEEVIDSYVSTVTEKRRKKVQEEKRVGSFRKKKRIPNPKKYIIVKKKVTVGPSPRKRR